MISSCFCFYQVVLEAGGEEDLEEAAEEDLEEAEEVEEASGGEEEEDGDSEVRTSLCTEYLSSCVRMSLGVLMVCSDVQVEDERTLLAWSQHHIEPPTRSFQSAGFWPHRLIRTLTDEFSSSVVWMTDELYIYFLPLFKRFMCLFLTQS